jgi:hypothetical protein
VFRGGQDRQRVGSGIRPILWQRQPLKEASRHDAGELGEEVTGRRHRVRVSSVTDLGQEVEHSHEVGRARVDGRKALPLRAFPPRRD